MISLPPGCSVNYSIFVELDELTKDMVEWYQLIGGIITDKQHYNRSGKEVIQKFVQYGKGKPCYYRQDGTRGVRLHFHGDDASVASMFIVKFFNHVEQTNLDTHMDIHS